MQAVKQNVRLKIRNGIKGKQQNKMQDLRYKLVNKKAGDFICCIITSQ